MQVLFSVIQREMFETRRTPNSNGNMRTLVRLFDGSLYPEKARIDFLDVQVNPRTDGQTVRAMFPNPEDMDILTTGQTVRAIIEQKGHKLVVIPQSAIAIDQTAPYVFVVGNNNKVEQRRVQLGTGRERLAVITEGLNPSERVVVQGQQRIRAAIIVPPQTRAGPTG